MSRSILTSAQEIKTALLKPVPFITMPTHEKVVCLVATLFGIFLLVNRFYGIAGVGFVAIYALAFLLKGAILRSWGNQAEYAYIGLMVILAVLVQIRRCKRRDSSVRRERGNRCPPAESET